MTLDHVNWDELEASLSSRGYAAAPTPVLDADECRELMALYDDDRRFRSRIDMTRYRFGEGEYKYFANPLPPLVRTLRERLYPPLADVANRWMEQLEESERYPERLETFLERCAASGQTRPTPLLLRYEAGGYNCLHQDIYGDVAFPLQAVVFLSKPGVDHEGGEFLLVEQRPRAQSRAEVVVLERGEAVIFPNRHRPVAGARGAYRATVRHGVSRVTAGERLSLGVIFHDAE